MTRLDFQVVGQRATITDSPRLSDPLMGTPSAKKDARKSGVKKTKPKSNSGFHDKFFRETPSGFS